MTVGSTVEKFNFLPGLPVSIDILVVFFENL